jgi:predicted Zn finger-like uncharacterized protein
MRLAEGIRTRGYRKWYEHERVVSHAHLVLIFVSAIGLFGALDSWLSLRTWSERAPHLLAIAETAAHQANCPQCTTYGRLELVQADAPGAEVQVRCRKCGHGWHISA